MAQREKVISLATIFVLLIFSVIFWALAVLSIYHRAMKGNHESIFGVAGLDFITFASASYIFFAAFIFIITKMWCASKEAIRIFGISVDASRLPIRIAFVLIILGVLCIAQTVILVLVFIDA